jgi:CheY-like chemotaxis protein
LVADDHVDTAESTCALLESFGCTTAVAYDGAAALALVDVFRPQVVILDLEMPLLSGLDVARRIRAQPSHQPPRLIAMTGQSRDTRQRALDAGFDEFVCKTVETGWLQRCVKQWRRLARGASPSST